jgi:glycosyltransferase involved in cell wall biosynthesis
MRIASIAAGAAGTVCGSCFKDNTLAAALVRLGHDCRLLPTFTPLTLDEPDQSTGGIFLGGINVFLDEYRSTRWLPAALRRWLDRPWVLRRASRFSGVDDYHSLGELTLSMLRGEHGRQKAEFIGLVRYLGKEFRPDVVLLTNVLLSGLAPAIRAHLGVPVVATLQGDDLFLDALSPGDRGEALRLIRANAAALAGFIATSADYADHMAVYLGIPRRAIDVVYPGIRVEPYAADRPAPSAAPAVGYFARIAPEKGLHRLADAFIALCRRPGCDRVRLRVSGWLGPQHRAYFDGVRAALAEAGLAAELDYVESPALADKVRFLQSLDVLCVPATCREPKGIYVLEALACGVPVVLPRRGAFPELLAATDGGRLVESDAPSDLADALAELIADPALRQKLGRQGRAAVRQRFTDAHMAAATAAVLHRHAQVTP